MNENQAKLEELLPTPIKPVGSYVFTKQIGDLVFSSGIIPLKDGKLLFSGKLGANVSVEEGQECARLCAINALSLLREHLGGSLAGLREVVSLRAIVSGTAEFTDHAKVANGASDFLVEHLGESAHHVRAAFGANSLPLDAPVEIEFVFRVSE
ncbi:RidA family protein [bacterium]|nr:RidA family protein [bacterium]